MFLMREAWKACRRLWKDDSGVVLALTVVMFLIMFVMASAVYAIGETVRQRVEIQNAADAAAYSGAIVEADTLSRIAVINRAMAWTYRQMSRRVMDHIVDKWLELAFRRWEPDYQTARQVANASDCSNGRYTGPDDWYVGQGYGMRTHMELNRKLWVDAYEIDRETGKVDVRQEIEDAKQLTKDMNQAEEDLIKQLKSKIEDAVRKVLEKNLSEDFNDQLAGGADISFCLKQAEDHMENFEIMKPGEEKVFLAFSDPDAKRKEMEPEEAFQPEGTDLWFVQDDGTDEGFKRLYEEQGSHLVATWDTWGRTWKQIKDACVPVYTHFEPKPQNEVWASEAQDAHYETETAKPYKLKKDYFAKGGSIVVGVSRRMVNPLYFVFQSKGEEGIFKAFTLNDDGRFMWAVGAAIAGFNKEWDDPSEGEYDPTYWDGGTEYQNLKNVDWDAVLLPLYRAWAKGEARSWDGETAGEILADVKGGPWEPLTGGGGAVGDQSAPKLMGGGEPAWGGMNGWTVH